LIIAPANPIRDVAECSDESEAGQINENNSGFYSIYLIDDVKDVNKLKMRSV